MNKILNLTLIVIALGMTACSSMPKMKDFNRIESGMSRRSVEKILGEPKTTLMKDGRQILVYDAADGDDTKPRWVVFQDGEVYFYGKPSEYTDREAQKASSPSNTNTVTVSPTISPVFNVGGASSSPAPASYVQAPTPVASKADQYNKGERILFVHENPGTPAITQEGN